MNLSAPHGYGEVVPLLREHRVRRLPGAMPGFCRASHFLAICASEFAAAGREYPIAFITLDGGATFAPVVVLGLQPGHNAFVDEAGRWAPQSYVPAFARRYPFCLSKLYVDGVARSERVVCVARSELDPAGEPLFGPDGQPTAPWRAAEALLLAYEADLDRTAELCAALARLRLLEPFTVQAFGPGNDAPLQASVSGLYRFAEGRLAELKASGLRMLAARGFLGLAYAQLHSTQNFARLLQRPAS